MRSISIMVVVASVLLVGVGAYLVVQNRNSVALRSKMIPALVIAAVGGLLTIYLSLESKSIGTEFTATLFFNKVDKRPLDEHCRNRYKIGGGQFDIDLLRFIKNHIEEQISENAVLEGDSDKIQEFYYDVIFLKLIDRFFWMYADWWDVRTNSVRRGDTTESTVTAISKPACDVIRWEDLLKDLDAKDNFRQLLLRFSQGCAFKKMTVPPKTKVGFRKSNHTKTLVLTNPFARVYITIYKRGGSIGLGDYQWLLDYDKKKSEEFWSEYYEVSCKAEFEKFRSGHPEMTRYKRWAETMFAEVEYQLNDTKRLERAFNYRDLISP